MNRLREAACPEEEAASSTEVDLSKTLISSPGHSRRSPEGASPRESQPSARQQARTSRTPLLIVACVRCGVRPKGAPGSQSARRTSQRPHGAKAKQAQLRRQLEQHSPDSIVRLNALRGSDLQDVAMKLLGAETIPPQLSSFLLNKSEGNPLYCLEIMAFLQV